MFNRENFSSLKEERGRPGTRIGGRERMPANDVRFGVKNCPTDKKPTIQIVLGLQVMRNLHWKVGDKVNVLYNDMHCVVERDNGGFWRIGKDGASKNFLLSFTPTSGKWSVVPRTVSREKVTHKCQDDMLMIAW